MNGVVFLSYSASERGERWGPGGTDWVVSVIAALCVFICALMVVCAYKQARKRRASESEKGVLRAEFMHGDNEKVFHICLGLFDPFFSCFSESFPTLRVLLLFLCHCYSTQSLHMHIL